MSDELKPCPFCGVATDFIDVNTGEIVPACKNIRCLVIASALTIEAWNTRPLEEELHQRIADLESLLRWRPVSTPPEQNGYYEVEFDNGNFHDMIFYNEHSSWRCSQEHVNITGWRPIPELEQT